MISPSQRPLPDNTQHSQQTNIHAPGGIRTHDRRRRAAVDLRLRPRGYWDRHHPTDALNKIQFMTGIETPTCFGTVASSSVAFFVGTASGRQPAVEVLPSDLTLNYAISWLAGKLNSLINLVQLVRIIILTSSSGY